MAGGGGSAPSAGQAGNTASGWSAGASTAALPPWLTYCGANGCPGGGAAVVACAASDPDCTPSRTTALVPSVDGRPISGVFFPVTLPNGATLRLDSGNGSVLAHLVWSYASPIVLASDLDVLVSYYAVAPVWGGTTSLDFESTSLSSELVETVFYAHPSYATGSAALDLHEAAQRAVTIERAIAGLTPEKARAFFMPSELAGASGGEGNFSYGNGTVTINYGNPAWVAHAGGVLAAAMPRFDHEYAHELFDEVRAHYLVNSTCLNEGLADALPFVAGLTSESELGPVGVRGIDFDANCTGVSEIHDVGNCYFWHLYKAGLLDETLLRGVFHPQHTFRFDSCRQNDAVTGNSLLVLFTEASGGADVIPALDSMQVPHAATYDEARQALGL